jgi:LacI family transcriptional regulator
LGHRNICVISGITNDNDRTTKRLEGIRAELLRNGIKLRHSMIIERPYSISDGRKACALLLSRDIPPPTAIICGNDVLALGALIECTERGFIISDNISVVGFDNLEISMHSNPPLTTIDVPAEEMGRSAAGYILGKFDGNETTRHQSVSVQLILRNSSGPPIAQDPH